MANFKKSLFGGYNKSAIDTAFEELNQKLNDLQGDNKRLKNENDILKKENEHYKLDLEKLAVEDNEKNESNEIDFKDRTFKYVEKICERAYGIGADIVSDSKNTAQTLLDGIDEHFTSMINELNSTIISYETVEKEIKNLFLTINSDLNGVVVNTDNLLDKAKNFTNLLDEMRASIDIARYQNEKKLSDFESNASEFIFDESTAKETSNPVSATPKVDISKSEVVVSEKNESTVSSVSAEKSFVPFMMPSVETSEKAEETVIDSGAEETLANIFVTSDETASKTVSLTEEEIVEAKEEITVETKEEIKEEQTKEIEDKIDETIIETEEEILSNEAPNDDNDSADEQKPIRLVNKSNDRFTQYGRKSKISSKDRNELLKQALLKNEAK